MTKEALKLALEALEDIGDEWGFTSQRTVPKRKEAITAIKEALANEALEKMAENARELGLDYEPPPRTWVGLTDEDCGEVERWVEFKEEGSGRVPNLKLIRYIEAKLKEKNG